MRDHDPKSSDHARADGAARRGPRRPRRSRHLTAAAGLLLLAGCAQHVAGSATLAADARPPTPTASPTPTKPPLPGGDCPQGKVDTTADSEKAVILTASPDKLPADPSQTLQDISLTQLEVNPQYARIPGSRAFLETLGYVTGTTKAWTRGAPRTPGNRSEYVTLYEFEDSAGACAFTKWQTVYYKYLSNPDYASIGMVGGYSPPSLPSPQSAGYLTSKGRFVMITGVVYYPPPGTPGSNAAVIGRFTASLLNMQYQRV